MIREKLDTSQRKSSGSLEFLANIFTRKEKSPARSQSPVKQPSTNTTTSKSSILKLFRSKSQDSIDQQHTHQTSVPAIMAKQGTAPMPAAPSGNVQDLIRSELKKIVQMQHDTVMSFLNGGTQMTQSNSLQNGVGQQLGALLKQQHTARNHTGEPVEFIIETKVKSIDVNGQVSYTDFMPATQQQFSQPQSRDCKSLLDRDFINMRLLDY